MALTGRGPCNNFPSFLYALLIENSVSRNVCGNVRGVIQVGGNQPADVFLLKCPPRTIPKITIIHRLYTYPLLIH